MIKLSIFSIYTPSHFPHGGRSWKQELFPPGGNGKGGHLEKYYYFFIAINFNSAGIFSIAYRYAVRGISFLFLIT